MRKLLGKKFLAGLATSVFLTVIIFPFIIHAQVYTPLITCDGSAAKPCNFAAFILTINRIINWIISIALVIFTISAIWGGFLYMTSGAKPGNKEKAKSILWSTLSGFVIILVAWLIVYTIVHYLVDPQEESSILRFL
jgi:hypothetical protein